MLAGEVAVEDILKFNLTHSGMMLRLAAYRATDGYPTRYPHIADTMMAARLCAVGSVGYIDRALYAFRQHGSNLHVQPQLDVVREEVLPMIAEIFAGPLGDRIPDRDAARRRIDKRRADPPADPVHLPGRLSHRLAAVVGERAGHAGCHRAPTADPVLVIRTMFGQRGYQWLRDTAKRVSPGSAADATVQFRRSSRSGGAHG